MAGNAQKIIERYGDGQREEGRSAGGRAEYRMQFHYTEKTVDRHLPPNAMVAELGCGTGHYGLYLAEKCREYHGIDIAPGNIDLFQKKIDEAGWRNVHASVGDATALPQWEDEAFDMVLVFGPMYHLPPQEREQVFSESVRICKQGGVLLYYYISAVGVYLYGCRGDGVKYPNLQANRHVLREGTDDTLKDVFFYVTPERMEADARRHGLAVLGNSGVDFSFVSPSFEGMDEDKERAWMELFDFMYESPSCTGVSNHAILACRKP